MNLEKYVPMKKPLKKDFEFYIINAVSLSIKESFSLKIIKKTESLLMGIMDVAEDVIVVLNKDDCASKKLYDEEGKEVVGVEKCKETIFYGNQIQYTLSNSDQKHYLPENIIFQSSTYYDYRNFKKKEHEWALDYKNKYESFKQESMKKYAISSKLFEYAKKQAPIKDSTPHIDRFNFILICIKELVDAMSTI